jgi:hypothetical protein
MKQDQVLQLKTEKKGLFNDILMQRVGRNSESVLRRMLGIIRGKIGVRPRFLEKNLT